MYRRHSRPAQHRSATLARQARWVLWGLAGVALASGLLSFHRGRAEGEPTAVMASLIRDDGVETRRRLLRAEIPSVDYRTVSYGELFNDINSVQLQSAVRNGVRRPATFVHPRESDELVPVAPCELYWVDTMRYSLPLLVPEASLLLRQIGMRFQQVMEEECPDMPHCRLVVTSCFRTQDHVELLRHHNRNATENSCHCYGTTMDISHLRFLSDSNETVSDIRLKQALAQALYELRYEGLCWVKYERRQACFHITLRSTQYEGARASVTEAYPVGPVAAASPRVVVPKAAAQPQPSPVPQASSERYLSL